MCTYGLDSIGCSEGSVIIGCLVSDTEDRFIALEIDWTEQQSDDTEDDDDDTMSGDGKTSGENGIDSSRVDFVDCDGGEDSISDANMSDDEGDDFPRTTTSTTTNDIQSTPSLQTSQIVGSSTRPTPLIRLYCLSLTNIQSMRR